jgi:predicted nucleic acid-binding protein
MSPSFIIDCSITMAWCFTDEAAPASTEIQDRLIAEAALVPSLWFLEVVNVLSIAERRKRISLADSTAFIELLGRLDIQSDDEVAERAFYRLPQLCRSYGLSSYDAAYLDLAIRHSLPLATLDDELRAAAKSVGITLLGK